MYTYMHEFKYTCAYVSRVLHTSINRRFGISVDVNLNIDVEVKISAGLKMKMQMWL